MLMKALTYLKSPPGISRKLEYQTKFSRFTLESSLDLKTRGREKKRNYLSWMPNKKSKTLYKKYQIWASKKTLWMSYLIILIKIKIRTQLMKFTQKNI